MYFDAFPAGIEPGGLRNTEDIGILICYILSRIDKPFSGDELTQLIQSNGIANYFEINSAVSELIKQNNIRYSDEENNIIEVTKNGKLISQQLSSELPSYIRQKALSLVLKLIERKQLEKENPVTISKAENGGFDVNIRITDGMRDLMSLTVFVPDISEANAVRDNFYDDPERLYTTLLSVVTNKYEIIGKSEDDKNE